MEPLVPAARRRDRGAGSGSSLISPSSFPLLSPSFAMTSPLSCLPIELLHHLLQYLHFGDILSLEKLLHNSQLRRSFHAAIERYILPEYTRYHLQYLPWLLQRRVRARDIIASGIDELPLTLHSSQMMSSLRFPSCAPVAEYCLHLQHCPALTSLEFGNLFTTQHFQQFLLLNPQIQRIKIRTSRSEVLEMISNCCPNLTALDLSDNRWLGDHHITQLTEGKINLVSLKVNATAISSSSIPLLIAVYPNLHRLDFGPYCISAEMRIRCLKEIVIPAVRSDDPDVRVQGLKGLVRHVQYQDTMAFLGSDAIHLVVSLIMNEEFQTLAATFLMHFPRQIISNHLIPNILIAALKYPHCSEIMNTFFAICRVDVTQIPLELQYLELITYRSSLSNDAADALAQHFLLSMDRSILLTSPLVRLIANTISIQQTCKSILHFVKHQDIEFLDYLLLECDCLRSLVRAITNEYHCPFHQRDKHAVSCLRRLFRFDEKYFKMAIGFRPSDAVCIYSRGDVLSDSEESDREIQSNGYDDDNEYEEYDDDEEEDAEEEEDEPEA